MPLTALLLILGTFALFFLMGIGISLRLISRQDKDRFIYALCLAPAVGLMLTNLILYPLVIYDQPVRRTSVLVFAVLLAGNILLISYEWIKNRHIFSVKRSLPVVSIMLISVGFMLLTFVLPMAAGGLDHTLWQGGPWDARDFMLIGWHAQNLPWSYSANPALYQSAVQANPALSQVIDWMNQNRATVSVSFAWVSQILQTPIATVYYPYKLACLLMAFFAAFALTSLLKLPMRYRFAAALLVAVGFWAFYVIDIDAPSQTTSIAMAIVFLFAWIEMERYNAQKLLSWERFFVAFSLAAIVNAYVELSPFPLAAMGLYYVLRAAIMRRLAPIRDGLRHLVTYAGVVILILPTLGYFLAFAKLQFIGGHAFIGIEGPNYHYFFDWLLNRELLTRGFWGLLFYSDLGQQLGIPGVLITLVTVIVGGVLTLILLSGILLSFRSKADRPDVQMLSTFIAVFWVVGLVLFLVTSQRWAGGKAFSYSYAFVLIALTLFTAQLMAVVKPRILVRAVQILVLVIFGVWTFTQATTFVFRTAGVRPGANEPQGYVTLKMPGIDGISPILDSFKSTPAALVMTDFGLDGDVAPHTNSLNTLHDLIVPYGWLILMEDGPEVLPLQGTGTEVNLNFTWNPSYWKETNAVPDRILVAQYRDYMALFGLGKPLAASKSLALYQVSADDFDQALVMSNILRPDRRYAIAVYGADDPILSSGNPNSSSARWFVGQQSRLRFVASGTMAFTLDLTYDADFDGQVVVSLNGQVLDSILVARGTHGTAHLNLRPQAGTNWLTFDYTGDAEKSAKRLLIHQFTFAAS